MCKKLIQLLSLLIHMHIICKLIFMQYSVIPFFFFFDKFLDLWQSFSMLNVRRIIHIRNEIYFCI